MSNDEHRLALAGRERRFCRASHGTGPRWRSATHALGAEHLRAIAARCPRRRGVLRPGGRRPRHRALAYSARRTILRQQFMHAGSSSADLCRLPSVSAERHRVFGRAEAHALDNSLANRRHAMYACRLHQDSPQEHALVRDLDRNGKIQAQHKAIARCGSLCTGL